MSDATPNPATTPSERRLALLEQLAELGIGFLQAIKDDIAAAHEVQAEVARQDPTCRLFPPFDFAETSHAFARISRAVRLTLALHARLEAGAVRPYPLVQAQRGDPPSSAARTPDTRPVNGAAPEAESRERLSDPDELDTLLAPPAGAVLDQICSGLGLMPQQAEASQALWVEPAKTTRNVADTPPAGGP
jgi:hypothetical protein